MSEPLSDRDLRDRVHGQLTALYGDGGALAVPSPALGVFLDDAGVLIEVFDEYLAQQSDVPTEARAAIVTAGPPGAGKSTHLSAVDGALTGEYRRIDPDEIRRILVRRAEEAGLLQARHGFDLADGGTVHPAELGGWFHETCTDLADASRRRALDARENVLIEGTLKWEGLPRRYVGELLAEGYESLDILDVEVPLQTAIEGTRFRWWSARCEASEQPRSEAGLLHLGGRFMLDEDVRQSYYRDDPTRSKTAENAQALRDLATKSGIMADLRVITRGDDTQDA